MDNQKTKRRLASYRSLRLEVDNQLDRLARLRNEEQLPAMRESSGAKSTGGNGDRMERAILRRMAYEERVLPKIEAAQREMAAIEAAIDRPCVVAFACLRYHGKSFVRKLANGTGPITTWQSLKIGVALFLWGRAQKKDPWGELYRIPKFAQAWKEGDSI